MTCYIYVIAHSAANMLLRPIKVGISKSPVSRIASLQTGNPASLEFAFYFKLPDADLARYAESKFHSMQSHNRLSGEWFDIDPVRAIHLLCEILSPELCGHSGPDSCMTDSGISEARSIVEMWKTSGYAHLLDEEPIH